MPSSVIKLPLLSSIALAIGERQRALQKFVALKFNVTERTAQDERADGCGFEAGN
jgi:hypothetical protein